MIRSFRASGARHSAMPPHTLPKCLPDATNPNSCLAPCKATTRSTTSFNPTPTTHIHHRRSPETSEVSKEHDKHHPERARAATPTCTTQQHQHCRHVQVGNKIGGGACLYEASAGSPKPAAMSAIAAAMPTYEVTSSCLRPARSISTVAISGPATLVATTSADESATDAIAACTLQQSMGDGGGAVWD